MVKGTSKDSPSQVSEFPMNVYRVLVLLGVAVLLGLAFAVPFYYETESLWYKLGADKVVLRTGQLAGLLTLVLLILQILLSLRARFLEHLFGGANLIRWHRANGILIACIAVSHVLLVLAPEGFANLPIGKKYWPEMVGGLVFLLLQTTVLLSQFRAALHLEYKKWRTIHQPLGYLVLALVLIHVLFVSDSFAQGAPRLLLLLLFGGVTLSVVLVKAGRARLKS
jgi:predicted ferric reductase